MAQSYYNTANNVSPEGSYDYNIDEIKSWSCHDLIGSWSGIFGSGLPNGFKLVITHIPNHKNLNDSCAVVGWNGPNCKHGCRCLCTSPFPSMNPEKLWGLSCSHQDRGLTLSLQSESDKYPFIKLDAVMELQSNSLYVEAYWKYHKDDYYHTKGRVIRDPPHMHKSQ